MQSKNNIHITYAYSLLYFLISKIIYKLVFNDAQLFQVSIGNGIRLIVNLVYVAVIHSCFDRYFAYDCTIYSSVLKPSPTFVDCKPLLACWCSCADSTLSNKISVWLFSEVIDLVSLLYDGRLEEFLFLVCAVLGRFNSFMIFSVR